jgi:hypothetical protein
MITKAQLKKLPVGEYLNSDLYRITGTQCLPQGAKSPSYSLHKDEKTKTHIRVIRTLDSRCRWVRCLDMIRFLKKEIQKLESIVTTETLKESIARETREAAEKRIEDLKTQVAKLENDNPGHQKH